MAGFGGIRHALLANLVLLLGMAWSFGYVTLVVGHLNILSVSFTATLIGIGIDYGVYYSARYLQLRDAALLVWRRAGACVIRGGAVDPHRRRHYGRGVLRRRVYEFHRYRRAGRHRWRRHPAVRVAELVVLPAVICLVDRSGYGKRMPESLPIHALINPLMRMPRLLLFVIVAGTVGISFGMSQAMVRP